MTYRTFLKSLVFSALLCAATSAYALTPTLSLSTSSNGDSVILHATADARSNIKLYYTDSSGVDRAYSLGTTDTEGLLSTTISTSDRHLSSGSSVYIISSVSGQQSSTRLWPFFGSTNISFPVSSFTVPVGESGSLSVTNPSSAALTLKSNTSPVAVSASLSGSQLIITGRANGSTTLTVCMADGSDCENLPVIAGSGTVSGTQALGLSKTNPVLIAGKNATIYINGTTQAYYISSNSSPSVVQANASSNYVTLHATAAGSSKVMVCSPSNACSTMNVSVLASTNDTKDAPLALSRDHVSVAVGENTAVLIAGTGSFTSKSNNSSIATSSITNDTRVVITGSAVGTATITVCDASKNCEFVSVAVTPAPPAPVTPSIPVPPVQTSTSTSAGTFMFTSYLKPGSSGGEVTALQSMLKLIGYFKGTPNGNYGPQTEGAVKAFQKAKGLAQLGIVGPGTRAALNTLGNSSTATPTPAPAPTTPSSSAYTFTKLIKLGATGIEVTELQKRLTALGFYNGPLNGTFGPLTVAAVKKLQTAHHITPAGYVGPATRAFLN